MYHMCSYEAMLATYTQLKTNKLRGLLSLFMFPVNSESTRETIALHGTKHGIVPILMVYESSVSVCLHKNNFIHLWHL